MRTDARLLIASSFFSGLLLFLGSWGLLGSGDAARNFSYGLVFSLVNLAFYSYVVFALLSKKNIAYSVLIIVTKYTILLFLAFSYVARLAIIPFVIGVVAQLMVMAMLFLLLRVVKSR